MVLSKYQVLCVLFHDNMVLSKYQVLCVLFHDNLGVRGQRHHLRYQGTPNDNIAFSPFEHQAFHKDPNKLYIF